MFNVRILNGEDVKKSVDILSIVETVENVYKLKQAKKADVWPMIFHEFERGVADMDIKSGYITEDGVFGLKVVSWFGENAKKDMPMLIGTLMIFDMETGKPLAILNAEYLTGMRTAAAAAIGAKYLARQESETLLIVGAGHQARFQIAAMLSTMNNIKNVMIYDPIDNTNAVNLENTIKQTLFDEFLSKYDGKDNYNDIKFKFDIDFKAVTDLESAVKSSDIIITVTPSRQPMIKDKWVKPGTHISCVGSDMDGKQEVEGKVLARAILYVDDIEQAVNVGECEMPIKNGVMAKEHIAGEIGGLLLGETKGRQSNDDITVFDTTGIALQDLLTAHTVLKIAEQKGIGQLVDL